LLRELAVMANGTLDISRDWLGSARANLLAWWIPIAAILVSLSVAVAPRTVIWTVALIWMGTACILNARRCGRTHCRYTGPYYLAMVVPTLALGRDRAGWHLWLGGIGVRQSAWQLPHLVGDRTRLG
jgi:hypothetical protein